MKVAVDTNVLAYAEGVNGAARQAAAIDILDRLPQTGIILPAQALGELFNVLVRKVRRSATDARSAIIHWSDTYVIADTTAAVMLAASDLANDHRIGIWDAVILSASAESGCRLMLSEDMQDGFTWRGVTVANPFAANLHPLLAALMARESS